MVILMMTDLCVSGFTPDLEQRKCRPYRYIGSGITRYYPCFGHFPHEPQCKHAPIDWFKMDSSEHMCLAKKYLVRGGRTPTREDVTTFVQAFHEGQLKLSVVKDFLKHNPCMERYYNGICTCRALNLHQEQLEERQHNYVVPEITRWRQYAKREEGRRRRRRSKERTLARRSSRSVHGGSPKID